jgi:very-short-patch-repair endonuclease
MAYERGPEVVALAGVRMSAIEELFALHIRGAKMQPAKREHVFAAPRKWRLDFAWPEEKIAVEVEGGTWTNGRHSRGTGFAADCEKYARAAILGWTVLRVTSDHVRTGQAIQWLEELMERESV